MPAGLAAIDLGCSERATPTLRGVGTGIERRVTDGLRAPARAQILRVQLDDLIDILEESSEYEEFLEPVLSYRKQYGVIS